jgi:hypothetical protein
MSSNGFADAAVAEYNISTNGLTKTYKGVNALQDLTLQVPRGSICGFPGSTASTEAPPSSCCSAGPALVAAAPQSSAEIAWATVSPFARRSATWLRTRASTAT